MGVFAGIANANLDTCFVRCCMPHPVAARACVCHISNVNITRTSAVLCVHVNEFYCNFHLFLFTLVLKLKQTPVNEHVKRKVAVKLSKKEALHMGKEGAETDNFLIRFLLCVIMSIF